MRGSQVIESARLYKMGFPESMSNVEFVRRFGLLGDSAAGSDSLESILSNNDIDPASYRIGPSQVSSELTGREGWVVGLDCLALGVGTSIEQ